MCHVLALIALTLASSAQAKTPEFLSQRDPTCACFARAVNHFVALGESKGLNELNRLADRCQSWMSPHEGQHPNYSLQEIDAMQRMTLRIGEVCRVLFEQKGAQPLDRPGFGLLVDVPMRSMTEDRWPLFPVVLSGKTYFVLGEGYDFIGPPARLQDYIAYCSENGRYRAKPVHVPTREQALRDADLLRHSHRWRTLRWKASGQGFVSEELAWRYIRRQAERIPAEESVGSKSSGSKDSHVRPGRGAMR